MQNCVRGFINNEWDRDNLMFLITSNKAVLDDWYQQADEDDLVYAGELLEAYKAELDYEARNIAIEMELGKMVEYTDALNAIQKCKCK